MNKIFRNSTALCIFFALVFSSCNELKNTEYANSLFAKNESRLKDVSQLLMVVNASADDVESLMFSFERKDEKWIQVLEPFKASVGASGIAPAGKKKEGDMKTPSGIFTLGTAFGYEKTCNTGLEYRQTLKDDLFIDQPNHKDYNSWVKAPTDAISYEKMLRDDHYHRFGIVVNYNMNPAIPGKGSAIFIHLWDGWDKGSAGCIAMSEKNIKKILKWLDKTKHPNIIIGTKDFLKTLPQL